MDYFINNNNNNNINDLDEEKMKSNCFIDISKIVWRTTCSTFAKLQKRRTASFYRPYSIYVCRRYNDIVIGDNNDDNCNHHLTRYDNRRPSCNYRSLSNYPSECDNNVSSSSSSSTRLPRYKYRHDRTKIFSNHHFKSTTGFQPTPVHFVLIAVFLLLHWTNMSCAAPVSHSKRSVDDKPYWIQPCPGVTIDIKGPLEQDTDSESSILQSIITVAKIADRQAKEFREKYVADTFREEFRKHHSAWSTMEYKWLRGDVVLPIDLLAPTVSKEHLESLKLEEEALKLYGYLQRLAVAFEQVTKDHEDQNMKFKMEFKEAEKHLGKILCEIRDIIPTSKWELFKDATRDIMTHEFRHMGNNVTQQHVRDWLIFRDYMNLIEYIIQVMSFFKGKMI